MKKLINKTLILKTIEQNLNYYKYEDGYFTALDILDEVNRIPTEKTPREGKWILNGKDWQCSCCRRVFPSKIITEIAGMNYETNTPNCKYCPNCGADMHLNNYSDFLLILERTL